MVMARPGERWWRKIISGMRQKILFLHFGESVAFRA